MGLRRRRPPSLLAAPTARAHAHILARAHVNPAPGVSVPTSPRRRPSLVAAAGRGGHPGMLLWGGAGTPGSEPDGEAPELALADPVHQPATRTDSPAQIIGSPSSDRRARGIPFCPPHWNFTTGSRTP